MKPNTPDQWQAIIRAHIRKTETLVDTWDKHRRWYQGNWHPSAAPKPTGAGQDSGEEFIETNYPYAYIDNMASNVVSPNPAVTVTARDPNNNLWEKAREALVQEAFKLNKMHERLWLGCSLLGPTPRAFFKLAWDVDRQEARIRVLDTRYVFFDEGAESWEDVRYVIEVVPITKEMFDDRVEQGVYNAEIAKKADPSGYPKWLRNEANQSETFAPPAARAVYNWVTVYEIHDLATGKFFHCLDEDPTPLFEGEQPYAFLRNPYFMLTFTDNLEDLGGISDIHLIEPLQDQLNELDTIELNFVKTSLPMAIVHMGRVNNPDQLRDAMAKTGQPGAIAMADIEPQYDIKEAVSWTPTPTLVYNHAQLAGRLEDKIAFTLAMPEYSRGKVGGSDVATELALADASTRTRNGRRQKKVFDVIEWAARGVVALYEQNMNRAAVVYARLTGRPEFATLTRSTLGFVSNNGKERPLAFDYDVVPYSALENNKLVQLRNIQTMWPYLEYAISQNMVDKDALNDRILGLLNLSDVASKQPATPNALPFPKLTQGAGNGETKPPPLPGAPMRAAAGVVPGPMGGPGDGRSGTGG